MNIPKFPVVIIAPARSGSTSLVYNLGRMYNLTVWCEPDRDPEVLDDFFKFIKTSDQWILKILTDSMYQAYPKQFLNKVFSGKYYTIKLTRNNLEEQMASHYIATKRQQWVYSRNLNCDVDDQVLDIDYNTIVTSIGGVLEDNRIIDTLTTDVTLVYEEILPFLNESVEFWKTPQPANYNKIIEAIENVKKNSSYGIARVWKNYTSQRASR